jgi:hypothetical protein
VPGTPKPGVDVHAGEAVACRGELTLEGLAAHLAVAHDRQADFLLHRDDLAYRPVLGGLQSGRGQLTPGVSLARVTQESWAEQAPDMLNPRNHCHKAKRPIPALPIAATANGAWPSPTRYADDGLR